MVFNASDLVTTNSKGLFKVSLSTGEHSQK